MGRIARSWQLFKSSWSVLRQDKELAVLPLLSGIVITAICASFVLGFGLHEREGEMTAREGIITFVVYVLGYTTAFFFQAALVAGALERLGGGNPTLGSALSAATKRLPTLFLWGIVAATVGMLLRAIQERSGLLGKIISGIVGVAWSLATFFMVPVMVMEGQGVNGSFKRSWALFKQTWGETVVGNLGIGLFGLLAFLAVAGITALLVSMKLALVAAIVGVLGFVTVMVIQSALQGVFLASVYRYATSGDVAQGFDRELLLAAFREKPSKA